MDQKEFLQKIKNTVLSFDKDAQVILFGSRARGDHKPDSDWDILVLTTKEVNTDFKGKLIDSICDVELEYTQAVSPVIVQKHTWEDWAVMPLYKNVSREGITI